MNQEINDILNVKLAKRFSAIVQATFTDEEMAEVIRLNAEETDDCCHTHDFCDANMLMLTAYAEVFCMTEDEVMDKMVEENSKVIGHMNAAWTLAKSANFTF